MPRYLPRYAGHAGDLYRGFRSAISHNYSLGDLRLTDGATNAHRHWTTEEGELVLHLESFISDLDAAWKKFYSDVEGDNALRERVLARVRKRPLLGILGGEYAEASTSVARTVGIATGAFSGGSAQAASGASWPVPPGQSMPPVKFPKTEKKAIPKQRPKKR